MSNCPRSILEIPSALVLLEHTHATHCLLLVALAHDSLKQERKGFPITVAGNSLQPACGNLRNYYQATCVTITPKVFHSSSYYYGECLLREEPLPYWAVLNNKKGIWTFTRKSVKEKSVVAAKVCSEKIFAQSVPFTLFCRMVDLRRPFAILGSFKHPLSTTAHN